jgi:hypothetical protein
MVVRGTARSSQPQTEDQVALGCYADAVIASILGCLVTGVFLSLMYFSYLWLFVALTGAITHVFRSHVAKPSNVGRTA